MYRCIYSNDPEAFLHDHHPTKLQANHLGAGTQACTCMYMYMYVCRCAAVGLQFLMFSAKVGSGMTFFKKIQYRLDQSHSLRLAGNTFVLVGGVSGRSHRGRRCGSNIQSFIMIISSMRFGSSFFIFRDIHTCAFVTIAHDEST